MPIKCLLTNNMCTCNQITPPPSPPLCFNRIVYYYYKIFNSSPIGFPIFLWNLFRKINYRNSEKLEGHFIRFTRYCPKITISRKFRHEKLNFVWKPYSPTRKSTNLRMKNVRSCSFYCGNRINGIASNHRLNLFNNY